MPNIFGCKTKFAIEYTLLDNPYNEYGVLGQSFGEIHIWVRGSDICETIYEGVVYPGDRWNLCYRVDWFCNNLKHIFGFDPYPFPIEGNNTLEQFDNAEKYEDVAFSDDILDEDDNITDYDVWLDTELWFSVKQEWHWRHNLGHASAGHSSENIYFIRIGEIEEIVWNSPPWGDKEQVVYVHERGVYNMPFREFRDIVIDFLVAIIKEIEERCGTDKETKEWKDKITKFLWRNPFE